MTTWNNALDYYVKTSSREDQNNYFKAIIHCGHSQSGASPRAHICPIVVIIEQVPPNPPSSGAPLLADDVQRKPLSMIKIP